MKSNDADDNKFRISQVLIKSCSLMVKNFASLLFLSVVLFVVLDFAYDSVKEKVSERIPHDQVNTFIEKLKERDSVQAFLKGYDANTSPAESGDGAAPVTLSPVAFIFFSFLLPVAIIRLLFAGDPPQGSFIERVLHNYRHITSAGYIISSFRYVCAFIAQISIFLTVSLAMLMIFLAAMLEWNWIWALFVLLFPAYIYLLFRFTAVFQLAYVSISTENLGIWQSWRRGYALSSPSWGRISTLFAIIVPLLLLLFAGILVMLLPGEAPDGLGTLVSSHVINFLYVVLSAILSAVCYRELKRQDKLGI